MRELIFLLSIYFLPFLLGMVVSTLIINILEDASVSTKAILLSIGLVCLAIVQLQDK